MAVERVPSALRIDAQNDLRHFTFARTVRDWPALTPVIR
jgi:hypothetical protein